MTDLLRAVPELVVPVVLAALYAGALAALIGYSGRHGDTT